MKCPEPDFSSLIHEPVLTQRMLPKAGSPRDYHRLTLAGGRTLIGVVNADTAENRAFVAIGRALAEAGVNVPRIHAVSDDGTAYLQQDLGDTSLYAIISNKEERAGAFASGLMREVMRQLAICHLRGSALVDPTQCYPVARMGRRDLMWDLNYWKYCCLKPSGIEFDENAIEEDFNRLCDSILSFIDAQERSIFMLRDFQSRNVMVTAEGAPFIIDFQGGRFGLQLYDVVAFTRQARAAFTDSERDFLVNCYCEECEKIDPRFSRSALLSRLPETALLRTLQVLGAYGFRGHTQRRAAFLGQMPAALREIAPLLPQLEGSFPAITAALRALAVMHGIGVPHSREDAPGLTVTVSSFSYRKGYPDDITGGADGGGFIFDCRHIHNPGRYEEYKPLTGRDEPVRQFLENDGEILPFIGHVRELVNAAVDKYLKRGFTNLQVAFGCTGGRHRSVYSAESIAAMLRGRGDVNVRLIHREQEIEEYTPATQRP